MQETLIGDALQRVTELLPASWRVEQKAGKQQGGRMASAVVNLIAPNGNRATFAVETTRAGSVPTARLLTELHELAARARLPVLLASDYVGPVLRSALADAGVNFADATGWVRVVSEDPLILLTGQGAQVSPRPRKVSAVVRLNGVAASRTIRALASTGLPVGVREVADRAGVSPGSVSKLLATLAAEGIVDRDERGAVTVARRRALIRRWTRDYTLPQTNRPVGYYIAPRGIERTLARLGDLGTPVALTGSAAARRLLPAEMTPIVPIRLLAVYVANPSGLAGKLGLIKADPTTANVVLAAPQDPSILATSGKEPTIAPTALVIADLLTLPGRSDAEADQLMDALARVDANWSE